MYIQHRLAQIIYRSVLTLLSLACLISIFPIFGLSSWRLFATWFLLLATLYFAISAIKSWFAPRRRSVRSRSAVSALAQSGSSTFALAQNTLTISGLALLLGALILAIIGAPDTLAPSGPIGYVILYLLPLLTLLDWLLFAKKGQVEPIAPFYCLVPSVIYACLILLTALNLPADSHFRYPYTFLNYHSYGVWPTIITLALITIGLLALSYAIYGLDLLLSRHLKPELQSATQSASASKSKPQSKPTPKPKPKTQPKRIAVTDAPAAIKVRRQKSPIKPAQKSPTKLAAPKPTTKPATLKPAAKPAAQPKPKK